MITKFGDLLKIKDSNHCLGKIHRKEKITKIIITKLKKGSKRTINIIKMSIKS